MPLVSPESGSQGLRAFRTVRGRILFWTLAVTMPIYAGALYMSYQDAARGLEAGAERDLDELATLLASGLDAVIRPIEGGIRTVAGQLEEVDPPTAQYPARIRGILASWPDVYGSTIATEVDGAQPAVRKVLDIVKAIPPGGLFASVAELDANLDEMQRQVREQE
jgi:hypothetical protein